MPSMKWYQAALLGSGAAAGLSILLYYLFRDDNKKEESNEDAAFETMITLPGGLKRVNINSVTSAEVRQILLHIIESQEKMKVVMQELNKKFIHNDYTFEEMYYMTREVEPEDPLELTGLSMYEFDLLLERFEDDQSVREIVTKLMAIETPVVVSKKIEATTPELVIEIHEFMYEKLRDVLKKYEELNHKETYDVKTVTIVCQAIVSTSVEEKYNLTAEELEQAVLLHHDVLSTNEKYSLVNNKMQSIMTELIS